MKAVQIFTLTLLIFSGIVNANERNNHKKSNDENVMITDLIGKDLTNQKEINDALNVYLDIEKEGDTQYIFNPQNDQLVMYFKEGVKELQLTAIKKTSQLTNVYYKVNNDFTLHVVMYNGTKNIVDVRTRKYFPEYEKNFRVITSEKNN
ncbi:hypothetical protein [Flammeovirga pacifica]|uniref:Uncharacterized protein n=1 Tax=Flammeovirga pacifica TaxID=915059 RepID=A0A1S1YTR9_FLAPC|nr:hypothetical protein [Flammeovirga pacifica]OHX64253.1 hypothetical protein NH26_21875 [Flammeovirga pacifica]